MPIKQNQPRTFSTQDGGQVSAWTEKSHFPSLHQDKIHVGMQILQRIHAETSGGGF